VNEVTDGRGDTAADRARAAGERAARAGQRAAELHRRLRSLAEGGGSPEGASAAARAAYEESVVLAAVARKSAGEAFARAADAHRAAAELAQSRGDLVQAKHHRDLAEADDLSAAGLALTEG
jgi:hypothetical protein